MTRPVPTAVARERFDLIVVGAGVNGAAIARDAAMRGLRTLLLDRGDVGGGTTSWSSRLIHGGLRYLEHAEFGLVRESLRERERLLRNAPHLVRPIPFVLPIFADSRRGPRLIRTGMVLYDLLSFDKSLRRHRLLSRSAVLRRVPHLRAEGLRGAAVYYDAQATFAERLAIENALSAREHGAIVVTYAPVGCILTEGAVVRGVEFTDALTGDTVQAAARVVVNAAGPWVDGVLAAVTSDAPRPRLIGGTKGSHLVVPLFAAAPRDALYYEARADGRAIFIIPWNGMLLIGSTDIRFEGDPDEVRTDEEEVSYLLAETNALLPAANLTPEDVAYAYCGVRPLPYRPTGTEGAITRRHFVHDHAPRLRGLLSVVGGKLTTHRSLAEEVVDKVCEQLGRNARCATASVPLPGAAGIALEAFERSFVGSSGLPAPTAERLVAIYGARAAEVLAVAAEAPDLREPFDPDTGAIGAEVVFGFRHELAATLTDVLMRRTMVGLGPRMAVGADEAAAAVAERHLGWDAERARQEVAAYRSFLQRFRPRSLPVAVSALSA